jgi:hypothetical protein
MFVPIITASTSRMNSMKEHLERLVKRGQITQQESSVFIFGQFETLTSYGPRIAPNGRMFDLLVGK